jgi:hypothetical protein
MLFKKPLDQDPFPTVKEIAGLREPIPQRVAQKGIVVAGVPVKFGRHNVTSHRPYLQCTTLRFGPEIDYLSVNGVVKCTGRFERPRSADGCSLIVARVS